MAPFTATTVKAILANGMPMKKNIVLESLECRLKSLVDESSTECLVVWDRTFGYLCPKQATSSRTP